MRAMFVATALALMAASRATATPWNPESLDEEKTLEFRTTHTGGEDHWSTVWFVVLDGEVYVNLGAPAVKRLSENAEAPLVSVRIDDEVFERIRVEPAQDRQPAVAEAIAEKYWTGFLVPHRPPSTVLRLKPEHDAAEPPSDGGK